MEKMYIMVDKDCYKPETAHEADAGYDLRTPRDLVIPAHGSAVMDTGVHFQIPEGACGLLVSKSGLNVKFNLTSTGLIDSGYTGSVVAKLYNHGDKDKIFFKGDKITQIMFLPILKFKMELTEEFDETDRGTGGFGSTGK